MTQRPPTRKREVSQAFRRVVRFDLYKARDQFFAANKDAEGFVVCAETGERISRDQAQMDHRAPLTFEVIVRTFLASQGLALDQVRSPAAATSKYHLRLPIPHLPNAFAVIMPRWRCSTW